MRQVLHVINNINRLIRFEWKLISQDVLKSYTPLPNVVVSIIHAYQEKNEFFFMENLNLECLLELRLCLWRSTLVADVSVDHFSHRPLPLNNDDMIRIWDFARMRQGISWKDPEAWYTYFIDCYERDRGDNLFKPPPYNPLKHLQLKQKKTQSTIDDLEIKLKQKKQKLCLLSSKLHTLVTHPSDIPDCMFQQGV